jgi:radical SAM protein with 4Fe4S-binding SPASM domain
VRDGCKSLHDRNHWPTISDFEANPTSVRHAFLALHFNVTNTCNLSCKFCYADSIKAKTISIPIEDIRRLAVEAREVGCQKVILSGGEIFARDDWFDICQTFAGTGIEVTLVSNGTLISDVRIEKIKQIEGFSILISLDGAEETHDRIRGHPGSHAKTVALLEKLVANNIDCQVNATIIKQNFCDVIYLAELSLRLNVSMRFSLLNRHNGRGGTVSDDALTVEDIVELRAFCHALRQQGSKVFLNLPPLLQFPEDVVPIRSPSCGWTKSYCGVTNEGYVTVCGVAGADQSLYQGNILQQSFADIWRNSELFNYLRSLRPDDLTGICGRCKLREVCGGACRLSAYKARNDFTAPYGLCQEFYDMGLVPESALDPAGMRG